MTNEIIGGLKILSGSSLKEVENQFGTSAAREAVDTWYRGKLVSEKSFLTLMNHVNRSTLGDLSRSDWRHLKISVDKILDIQKEVLERKDYHHLLPTTIRDLLNHEKKESPESNFWLEDGIHRSLAIADLLIRGEIAFSGVEVFYGKITSNEQIP